MMLVLILKSSHQAYQDRRDAELHAAQAEQPTEHADRRASGEGGDVSRLAGVLRWATASCIHRVYFAGRSPSLPLLVRRRVVSSSTMVDWPPCSLRFTFSRGSV
jgi:hypothetical protein